jgi:hypothetical protein
VNGKTIHVGWPIAAIGILGPSVQQTLACAVCFGDLDSSMAKGAVAGVMVLAGIVGVVLAGITGTALFWVRRSRLMHQEKGVAPCRTP